jgi:hypothetical protein
MVNNDFFAVCDRSPVPLVRETGVPWPMSLAALIPKLRERVDSDSKMPPNAAAGFKNCKPLSTRTAICVPKLAPRRRGESNDPRIIILSKKML